MSPASTTCPRCRRTIWKGAACDCPRREPPAVPQPGSSRLTVTAIAVWVLVVAVVGGWVAWFVMGAR